jgi:hypothetical protein
MGETTTFDPLEASTRLGQTSSVPTSSAPTAEGFDPLAASTRLGGANPLTTSYEKVPTSTSRGIALGTRDMINAATGLPVAVADVATFLPRMGIRAAGGTATAPSDMWQATLDRILPRSETEGEKLRSAINEAAGAMVGPQIVGAIPRMAGSLPTIMRPMLAPAPATLPLAASQVAAGGAGGAAGEVLANDERVPEWLKPSARLAGNMIGTGGVSALTGAAGTLANAIQGVKTPIAEALERLGIVPRTVGAVTDRPGTQTVEAAATRLPFSSGVLQPAQRDTVDQFGNAVERTAGMLGGEATKQEAGGSVQQILQDWHANTFPTEQAAIWTPLNQRLAGASVDLSGYRRALEDMAYSPELHGMTETQRAFGSAQARQWLEALNADRPPGQNSPPSVSWGQAQAIKTQIGKAMGTPDIVSNMGMDRLRQLYAGLAGDMSDTATAHGQAGPFRLANQSTIDAHNFIDTTLVKAIKARNPGQETVDPDAAATALLNSNSAMQQLRDRVPQAADALGAYQLRRAAQAKPSQQGAGDTTSTGTFLTTMRKQQLDRQEGTAALYNDPAVASNVNDLLAVAAKLRETERLANISGTSGATQVATFIPRLAAAGFYGGPMGAAASAASDMAPYGLAKYLTSRPAIALASARPGPRPPIDSRVAGLLGYLANQAVPSGKSDRD